MLIIFVILYKLKQTWYLFALNTLAVSYVYTLEEVHYADKYMENLAILFKKRTDKNARLQLYSMLKSHYGFCKDMRCLCFLLKWRVGNTKEKRLIDELEKMQDNKQDLKLILYDDPFAMKTLLEEHMEFQISQLRAGLENDDDE